jgi:fucose permease
MRYYDITHTVVSLVFLSPFIGYVASALLNNYLHLRLGQRGIAMICSGAHLTAYIIIACHPPYIVLIFAFILAGFGNGTADAAWNAWVGNFANSSEVLGVLHACYGVGGIAAPLIASAFIAKIGLPWYNYYYFMVCFNPQEDSVTSSLTALDWHGRSRRCFDDLGILESYWGCLSSTISRQRA